MKGSKVDVKNSEDTSGIAGTFALTANGRGEPTLPPVLRQILIGICFGIGVLVVIITATVGALLNTNVRYLSQYVSQSVFIPPAKRSFRGVYWFQPVRHSVIP